MATIVVAAAGGEPPRSVEVQVARPRAVARAAHGIRAASRCSSPRSLPMGSRPARPYFGFDAVRGADGRFLLIDAALPAGEYYLVVGDARAALFADGGPITPRAPSGQ